MIAPTQDNLQALDALQRAVRAALDRKRRLGESAVIWQDGRPVITEGDMTTEELTELSKQRSKGRENTVLFIDARHIDRRLDRAHRDFEPEQIEFQANIMRLYRGEETKNRYDNSGMPDEKVPDGVYQDVPGLCKLGTIKESKEQAA